MAHIEFLDETMRDGQQSLWGMRMQAGMALPVAPLIDRSGFRVIDLAGSSLFEVMIRSCRENPWDGLDLLVQAMPRTRIRGGMRSNASVTFGVTPDSLMDAWMRQLNRHGCRSFWIYDVLFNIDKMHRLAKVAKEFGSEVAGAIMFALSPVHTDAYYADKADKLAASPDIDTLLLYDTAGVLDKERLQTLVPAIKAKARGKPIEFHANNILGQAAKANLDAIELGVSILHTASRPMANGPSVPSTEIMLHNIELLGHTHGVDKSLLPPVAEHFEKVGKAAGFLVNQHNEYDVLSISHQIPGGMTGTLKAQLAQHNMTNKLEDVLRERALVGGMGDLAANDKIRDLMERSRSRKLQPWFVESFFSAALQLYGGRITAREATRFEITRVPASIRSHADPQLGPVHDRYARITFDKSGIVIEGGERAELVSPGTPLLTAVVEKVLADHGDTLSRGATLVAPDDSSTEPRLLVYLDHTVTDGRHVHGQRQVVPRRSQ
jgi:hypothetical protein